MAGVAYLQSGGNLTVGRWSYGKPRILGDLPVTIGSFCSIADGVTINAGVDHRVDWLTTYPFSSKHLRGQWGCSATGHPTGKGPIIIGSAVWIGCNALIMSGVKIGHGAVIAAGSVVTRDVRCFSIVGGNPARHIRWTANYAARELMLDLRWWEWPDEVIRRCVGILCSSNLGALEAFYEENIIEISKGRIHGHAFSNAGTSCEEDD